MKSSSHSVVPWNKHCTLRILPSLCPPNFSYFLRTPSPSVLGILSSILNTPLHVLRNSFFTWTPFPFSLKSPLASSPFWHQVHISCLCSHVSFIYPPNHYPTVFLGCTFLMCIPVFGSRSRSALEMRISDPDPVIKS